MKAAYIYDSDDTQGPWILLCSLCIAAEHPHAVIHPEQPPRFSLGGEWAYDDTDTDWRCACCGYAPLDDRGATP